MNLTEKKKMVILAQQVINGSLGIVEGCRRIVSFKIYPIDDPDYQTIVGVESETDEFPIGDVRKHYHKASLEKLDRELNEYLVRVKPIVFEACKNLITKYGS